MTKYIVEEQNTKQEVQLFCQLNKVACNCLQFGDIKIVLYTYT